MSCQGSLGAASPARLAPGALLPVEGKSGPSQQHGPLAASRNTELPPPGVQASRPGLDDLPLFSPGTALLAFSLYTEQRVGIQEEGTMSFLSLDVNHAWHTEHP